MVAYTEAPTALSPDSGGRTAPATTEASASLAPDDGGRTAPPTPSASTSLGPANRDKPILARPEDGLTSLGGENRDKPILTRRADALASLGEDVGVIIPGVFRPVDVTVVDPDGDPLPEVDWVMSAGTFPTAARVDEQARATLYLLKTEYQDFMGVAERTVGDGEGADYTWYNPPDGLQESINPVRDKSAEVVLNPVEIKGLWVGAGTDFGGMLG